MAYNRQKAVAYAERWWNGHNPEFMFFSTDDCTNYISQCLWAGGAPMRGHGSKGSGWWYKHGRNPSWSYSWAVAHGLKTYLDTSTSGLRAQRLNSPYELLPGDVICYDFDGDGRWQHNSIVTAYDWMRNPLVNTHTHNRQHFHWSLRDSPAFTSKIKYAFYRIVV